MVASDLAEKLHTMYPQAAREALDRVLQPDPDNGRCWALLGALEQDSGNLAEAERCFRQGTEAPGELCAPLCQSACHMQMLR